MVFSGWIFGSTAPDVFSYPDLLFSILVLPLFYLFLRLYFNRFHSFLGVLLYSCSFLIIQYSRFSWNPNSVPFFILLTFYGLLKFLRADGPKAKLGWLAVLTLGAVIAGQFHFFAFFSLAGILGFYVLVLLGLWKKTGWKNLFGQIKTSFFWKAIAVVVIIVGLLYTPMIISEIKTGGSNSKNFIGAFSEKPKDKPLGLKIIRNFREQGTNYFLLMTSFYHRKGMKADPIPQTFSWVFLTASLLLIAWKIKKEKDAQRRNFLKLLLVWAGIFFVVTIPMSYQLRPRFFVVVFALPYIFSALWFDFFREKLGEKKSLAPTLIIVLLALVGNFYGIYRWFEQNRLSENQMVPTGSHYILKKDDGINLGQLEQAIDYVLTKQPAGKVDYYAKPEYEAVVEYLVKQKEPSRSVELVKETKNLEGKINLFAFNTTSGNWKSVSKKIREYAEVLESKQFGQLSVFYLQVNVEKLQQYLAENKEEIVTTDEIDSEAATGDETGDEATAMDDENPIDVVEKKTERLFWKDVWGGGDDKFKQDIRFKE